MRAREPRRGPETMKFDSSPTCAVPRLSHLPDVVRQGLLHIFRTKTVPFIWQQIIPRLELGVWLDLWRALHIVAIFPEGSFSFDFPSSLFDIVVCLFAFDGFDA